MSLSPQLMRKEERTYVKMLFTIRIFVLIAIWFLFKDVIDAPTWACWAVVVNLNFTWVNNEWLALLASRSV